MASPRQPTIRRRLRLTSATEQTLQRVIESLQRSTAPVTTMDAIAEVRRQCLQRQLPPPSTSTIRRRLKHVIRQMPPDSSTKSTLGTASHAPIQTDISLLSLVYETVGTAGGWNTFIDALARSYRGGQGVLLMHDTGIRNGFAQAAGQVEADRISLYNAHYAALNPWVPYLDKRPRGLVVAADSVLPLAELLKTEFYCDFLRPARVDSSIGLTLQRDGSRHMTISILFPHATAETDPDTVGRLQRLAPHLLRVAQLNRQLAGLEVRAATAEVLLNGLATGVAVVNSTSRLVYMNPAAERILTTGDGPTATRMVPDAVSSGEGQALRQLLASALQVPQSITGPPGGVMRINRRSRRMAYEVLVAPIAASTLGLAFTGPLAAFFIRDPGAQAITPLDRLRRLYTLTATEARLMRSLLAGHNLETISERDRLSKETLRSQLKAIFSKTSTHGQVELLRLGLQGMAAFQT